MTSGLRSSLAALIKNAGGQELPALQGLPKGAYPAASPLDFVTYFDLAVFDTPQVNQPGLQFEPTLQRAAEALGRLTNPAKRVPPGKLVGPRIATLGTPYFSEPEICALKRWWDTEPANSLGLVAVASADLSAASQLVRKALDELARSVPALHAEVLTLVQDIVLADAGDARRMDFGGVSSFAAWGAIAINQAAHQHWVPFMKTIVHESAHLLLFAIAQNEPLVLNDPAERHASPLRLDTRPLDGIFHAAFVSAREALALEACLTRHEERAQGEASVEVNLLEQALEESVFAFWDCCDQLKSHAHLSGLGEAILQDCRLFMEDAFEVLTEA